LWPADLDELPGEWHGKPIVRRVEARRIPSQVLHAFSPFSRLPESDVSALCALLQGHQYGLDLACRHLLANPAEGGVQRLNERLAGRRPDQRLREIFRIVRDGLEARRNPPGIACAFLERLGFFLNPICRETLFRCYEQAWQSLLTGEPGKAAVMPPRAE